MNIPEFWVPEFHILESASVTEVWGWLLEIFLSVKLLNGGAVESDVILALRAQKIDTFDARDVT